MTKSRIESDVLFCEFQYILVFCTFQYIVVCVSVNVMVHFSILATILVYYCIHLHTTIHKHTD